MEENAATAKTLENQSAAMGERIEFFKLEDSAGTPAPRRILTDDSRKAGAVPRQALRAGTLGVSKTAGKSARASV